MVAFHTVRGSLLVIVDQHIRMSNFAEVTKWLVASNWKQQIATIKENDPIVVTEIQSQISRLIHARAYMFVSRVGELTSGAFNALQHFLATIVRDDPHIFDRMQ